MIETRPRLLRDRRLELTPRHDFYERRSSCASHPPPARIHGATWQAGVTDHSSRFKVLLNGEPQPTAYAAKRNTKLQDGTLADDGWVLCLGDIDPKDPFTSRGHRKGLVQIIRGDRD